jgi:hypothetical protein
MPAAKAAPDSGALAFFVASLPSKPSGLPSRGQSLPSCFIEATASFLEKWGISAGRRRFHSALGQTPPKKLSYDP